MHSALLYGTVGINIRTSGQIFGLCAAAVCGCSDTRVRKCFEQHIFQFLQTICFWKYVETLFVV